MSRPIKPLTGVQEKFSRMSAQGRTRTEILKEVFGIDVQTADPKEISSADMKMYRWRRRPEFDSIWKDEVKKILYGCTAEAIQVIKGQMRDEVAWLQNKAANDLLNYGKQQIYGDEEKAVHVKIEGMPDLGSPDDG